MNPPPTPHFHAYRPVRLPGIPNPDPTGLLVECHSCGDVQIVDPQDVGTFTLLLALNVEPVLSGATVEPQRAN